MTIDGLVFWVFVLAWLVVVGILLFGILPRGARDAKRIVTRVIALADDSPLPLEFAKAQASLNRIDAAVAGFPVLVARAQAALVVIRTTRIVPPAVPVTIARIGADLRALRAALR